MSKRNHHSGDSIVSKAENVNNIEKLCKEIYTFNLRKAFQQIPERYQNWILRATFAIILICYFCYTVYAGPVLILFTVLLIQIKCFIEVINIGYKTYPLSGSVSFRPFSWYFLMISNYFLYGEQLANYFNVFVRHSVMLRFLLNNHRFVAFCLYFSGMVWFIASLRKKYEMQQFSLLAWIHLALIFIVVQSYMIVNIVFQGLIWLILPVMLVVFNDIMAFLVGNFFGKTPLIQVSPKKTWEGYIGSAVSTVIMGVVLSCVLSKYPYFTCPVKYIEEHQNIRMSTDCSPGPLFQLHNYTVSGNILNFYHAEVEAELYPFVFHGFAFALFSSIIAPFGGFFASGFKRAFQVKDFGGTIPGHGGVLDRFDCLFLMATFVNVYISSFIKCVTPEDIYVKILFLETRQQLQFFDSLKESLYTRNIY